MFPHFQFGFKWLTFRDNNVTGKYWGTFWTNETLVVSGGAQEVCPSNQTDWDPAHPVECGRHNLNNKYYSKQTTIINNFFAFPSFSKPNIFSVCQCLLLSFKAQLCLSKTLQNKNNRCIK
jgi:hypothetical protein